MAQPITGCPGALEIRPRAFAGEPAWGIGTDKRKPRDLSGAARNPFGRALKTVSSDLGPQGQLDLHEQAAAFPVTGGERSAMGLDGMPGDGQAQAETGFLSIP